MPTFLVTSKMSPELAERIEASVTGRRRTPGRRRLVTLILRTAVAMALVLAATSGVSAARRAHLASELAQQHRERARHALLEAVRAETAAVSDEDRQTIARVETWLVRLAGPFEGDHVAPEVRTADGARALFSRPAVYVRGARDAFVPGDRLTAAVRESVKDPLLACLLDPPATRAEKTVLAKGRAAHAGGARLEESAPNVFRVDDARAGLPFFAPEFARSIETAPELPQIEALRARFEKAPIAKAKRALGAEILVAAMDETESGTGPTEIDGERARDVRIAIVDLRASVVLVRWKRHVDPQWISPEFRTQYASVLDACALGYDVRSDLRDALRR